MTKQVRIGQNEEDNSDDDILNAPSSSSKPKPFVMSNSPVLTILNEIDKWSFDAFVLADATENRSLFVLGQALFTRYGFINSLFIPPSTVTAFLTRIESGYGNNDYHNSIHATDVTHSMHYFLSIVGLKKMLTDLEAFACLYAAIIHDYNHNGKTNRFLITTGADRALLYNDKSVQENHHLSASFFILKTHECNMTQNFSYSEYREFRTMVIDMVLSTDMAFHYQLVRDMKARMIDPSPITDKNKILPFVLHTADLSASAKIWSIHIKWVQRLFDEFFKQGDIEKELGIPVSPLCDRDVTIIPEAQIHWINFVAEPLIIRCGELMERVLYENDMDAQNLEGVMVRIVKPWEDCFRENKKRWKNKYVESKGARNSYANSKERNLSK